jgi:acyl carrier protein
MTSINLDSVKILESIEIILKKILKNNNLSITMLSTPEEISGWDSLAHIRLILEIESTFKIKFSTSHVMELVTIKKLHDAILQKME